MPLGQVMNGKGAVFTTDEGKAVQRGASTLEGDHGHMPCTWHLAKQLPRAVKLPDGSTIDEGTARHFCLTARGPLSMVGLTGPWTGLPDSKMSFAQPAINGAGDPQAD